MLEYTNGENTGTKISEVLRNWITNPRSEILKKGETLSDLDITELEVEESGRTPTSRIVKYPVDCIATAVNGTGIERQIHLSNRIVLKQYGKGVLKDSSGTRIEAEKVELEGIVLEQLSALTNLVPKVLSCNHTEIWMTELQGPLVSDRLDRLDERSTKILEMLLQNQEEGLPQAELVDKLGGVSIDITRDLKRRGYVNIRDNDRVILAPRFYNVFSFEESKIQERADFKAERDQLFRKAIQTLLKIQEKGNEKLEYFKNKEIPCPGLEAAIQRDTDYLEGIKQYALQRDEQRLRGVSEITLQRRERDIRRAVRHLNRNISRLPIEIQHNFLQGDGYPVNMEDILNDELE